jgi:glutaminase
VNPGAIAMSSMLASKLDSVPRIVSVLEKFSAMSGGGRSACSLPMYLSMLDSSEKDYTIVYWLKTMGLLHDNIPKKSLRLYFQICSLEANCSDVANMAATIANGGICPLTGVKCFESKSCKKLQGLLGICGMNDFSDKWSESIGLLAKCSLSGAVLIVIPKVMGICIYSPKIDQKGISTKAIEICKSLVQNIPSLKNYK